MSSFRTLFQFKRPENGYWSQGRFVQDTNPATIEIYASCQPASGQDMQSLPEGRRNKEAYVLYTATELFTADVKTKRSADQVKIGQYWYEVVKVGPFQSGVIPHYRAIVSGLVQ